MEKEFNLSDKINDDRLWKWDVKELIKDVMDVLHLTKKERKWLKKRVGDKLI